MNPFCPNLADPDIAQEFNLLIDQVGEDTAYWYYARFKGDFNAIRSTLTSRGVRAQPTPVRPNISLSGLPEGATGKSMVDPNVFKLDLSKEEVGETHNSDIWKIENYFGLASIRTIKGKKWKFFNPVSGKEKAEIEAWINQNHLDVKLGSPISWDGDTRGIRVVGWPKNVDEQIAKHKAALEKGLAADMAQVHNEANEDMLPDPIEVDVQNTSDPEQEMKDIRHISDQIGWEIRTGVEVLDVLADPKNVIFDARSAAVVDMLRKVIGRHPKMRIQIIKKEDALVGYEKSYAYYDPNTSTINLIDEAIHNIKNASYDTFIMSILHEYIHNPINRSKLLHYRPRS